MTTTSNPPQFCFVVMPFGVKAFNDGSGRTFDFDKVYRVVIQRAVRLAGLEPARADESRGSEIIHIDMFKSLRDNPIVLADLSLENPNVFYELGARHVMSSRGTVLMCRSGAELPFDVKLSRVVFYKYDGVSLDWEEAERAVMALKGALEVAREGRPDSPVHALLERVTRETVDAPATSAAGAREVAFTPWRRENLDAYQKLVADFWVAKKKTLAELRPKFAPSAFGCRALAFFCLKKKPLNTGEALSLTRDLYDVEQYDLVNLVFERLEAQEVRLRSWELMRYGSSLSEAEPTATGARKGLAYTDRALAEVKAILQSGGETPQAVVTAFHASKNLSGLDFWLWTLDRSGDDLVRAISAMDEALGYARRAAELKGEFSPSYVAQAHLKQMLMLRVQADDRGRPDAEGHGQAVMKLQPGPEEPTRPEGRISASYLRWYKAIVLADRGEGRSAFEMALANARYDDRVMDLPGCFQIGRRQYTLLRRFIEQYSHILNHPDLVGQVSQVLQSGQPPPGQ